MWTRQRWTNNSPDSSPDPSPTAIDPPALRRRASFSGKYRGPVTRSCPSTCIGSTYHAGYGPVFVKSCHKALKRNAEKDYVLVGGTGLTFRQFIAPLAVSFFFSYIQCCYTPPPILRYALKPRRRPVCTVITSRRPVFAFFLFSSRVNFLLSGLSCVRRCFSRRRRRMRLVAVLAHQSTSKFRVDTQCTCSSVPQRASIYYLPYHWHTVSGLAWGLLLF